MNRRGKIRVAIQSLGCKVNQYEALKVGAQFSRSGYRLCSSEEEADIYIVNTCTVTGAADRHSRKLIRRVSRKNSNALIVVTGCHAEAWNEALASHTRILKIPQTEKEKLYEKVEETLFGFAPCGDAYGFAPCGDAYGSAPCGDAYGSAPCGDAYGSAPLRGRPLRGSAYHTITPLSARTRAYLKIQDGCNRFCSFCIIPYIRGRSRSRPPLEILEEADSIIKAGHQEIVVTGICMGDYGKDLKPRETLSSLLERLLSLPGGAKFRLSSIDPCDMDEKLVEIAVGHSGFCKHLHLALQHGSDKILKKMGRDYTTQEFFILCRELRKRNNRVAITTDIITGFPGEQEEDFQATISLARALQFSKIHVFPYSERKGTGAVKHAGKVRPKTREERTKQLLKLSEELSRKFYLSFIGSEEEVLVEHERDGQTGLLQGYTSNYIPVVLEGNDELKGRRIDLRLTSLVGEKVFGRAKN